MAQHLDPFQVKNTQSLLSDTQEVNYVDLVLELDPHVLIDHVVNIPTYNAVVISYVFLLDLHFVNLI